MKENQPVTQTLEIENGDTRCWLSVDGCEPQKAAVNTYQG